MDKAQKQIELGKLDITFRGTPIALIADYRGLTVGQITKLRSELRGVGSQGRVVKNTLARISAERVYGEKDAKGLGKFLELFVGPTLLISSTTDPIAPAKVLAKFAKENEKLQIKGAILDGEFIDVAGVQALSTLPSREETLSMLLRVISAPATQLVRLMQAPGTQVVRVIDAHSKNLTE